MKEQIQRWFVENKGRFPIFFGVLLVGILCFEAGLLQGKIGQKTPLLLSIPLVSEQTGSLSEPQPKKATTETLAHVEPVAAVASAQVNTACAFVGSKNSNKYHLPSCTVAKRIKPENRVCFASKEEAEKKGYLPSCLK